MCLESSAQRDLHGALVHAVRCLPEIRVDGRWLEGERAVEQVAVLLRSGGADLAPAS